MKNIKYYPWVLILAMGLLMLSACNKYLDVKPKGFTLLLTVNDYDQWLKSTEVENSSPSLLDLLGDNYENISIKNPPTEVSDKVYLWFAQFDPVISNTPAIWWRHYHTIYYFNTVINNVDKATGGTPQQIASLKAEALIGRAYEYLCLVNEYGKPYNEATAATDLAVPFVTEGDIGTKVPARSTVKQIYDQIIADIKMAIPNLPANNNTNRFRGSIAAGYSILARTYLLMRNYKEAADNATNALNNGPNVITDLNNGTTIANVGIMISRKDAIYARYSEYNYNSAKPSGDFIRSMDPNDLRLPMWYYNYKAVMATTNRSVLSAYQDINAPNNRGTSVAEMRLIIAEYASRNGDLPNALSQLDMVRKCRINAANYSAFTSNNAATVLNKILAERSFEMPYNGTRWFDMRRLAAEGRMPEVTRRDAAGNVLATLEPNSPRYTLQIPLQITYYHPDWAQNQ